ncbi:MAG: DUF1934 family protein [Candidatus Izemoplasma sp.]
MKNILINFNIESLDSNKSFVTKGYIDNNQITFIDDESIENIIILKENGLTYLKRGESIMDFPYIENVVTKGIYEYMNMSFEFEIFTNVLNVSDGMIHIESMLYQDGEKVNESILDIKYQDIEED